MVGTVLTKAQIVMILWGFSIFGIIGILFTPDSKIGLLDLLGIEKTMMIRLICCWLILAIAAGISLWLLKGEEST
jgi:hypothetical protein